MDAVLSGKDCEYYALSLDGDETLDQTERDGFLAEDIRPQRQQASAGQLFTCSLIALIVGALAGFLGTGWRANTCPAACDPATSLCEAGIDQHSPIPQEVFLNRKHVPFIPHREYMGPSKEAARNWKHLTAGKFDVLGLRPARFSLTDKRYPRRCRFDLSFRSLKVRPRRPGHQSTVLPLPRPSSQSCGRQRQPTQLLRLEQPARASLHPYDPSAIQ